jgi:hypothetical protein
MTGKRNKHKPETFEKCVELAVGIIGKPKCRAEVEKIIMRLRLSQRLGLLTKEGWVFEYRVPDSGRKRAAAAFAAALRRLEAPLENLRKAGLKYSPLAEFPLRRREAERWRKVAEGIARTKSSTLDWRKYEIAEMAARLCTEWDVPLTTSPLGQFCRLAAVLYGFPKENFFYHCRAYLSSREKNES